MAITYHAGRRIQGLADDRSLTTQAVYTSTYGQSTYNKLNGTPQAYIGQKCGVELVSTANDGKKIKIGKWKLAREGTLSGLAYMKVEDSSGTVKATSTGVSVSSLILRTSGYAYVTFTLTEAVALYNGDRVYIEYTTADGSGSFLAVGEFYNGSTTIPTGFEFTAYNVADANGNNATGTWTDTGYPTLLTPDAIFDDQPVTDENQITNVQSGSRFEETDTRKIYYFSPETTGTTTATGTYTFDFPVGSYDNNRQGLYVATTSSVLYGKTINSVSFWLKKTGSPTGTAYVRVYSNSNSGSTATTAHEFGSIDVSTLTTSYQKYTFNTGSHTLSLYDTIGLEWTGVSTANTPVMQGMNSEQFDGTDTTRNRFTSNNWSPVTTQDIKWEVTTLTPATWTEEV